MYFLILSVSLFCFRVKVLDHIFSVHAHTTTLNCVCNECESDQVRMRKSYILITIPTIQCSNLLKEKIQPWDTDVR